MEKEITFVIEKTPEGGFSARASKADLSAKASTIEELKLNAWNEVFVKYEGKSLPNVLFSQN